MANFALIGYPLSHSFSQKYFTEKFKNQNLNHNYLNLEFKTIENIFDVLNEHKVVGFNVTIPHKENILPLLDLVSKEAQEIGAVNCVAKTKEGWYGFNTDYIGFKNSIAPLLKPHHKNALVLGSGGASKAIMYALKQLQIEAKIVSRTPTTEQVSYSDLKERLKNYQIVINTTPLGTYPNIETRPPLPYQELTAKHLCYDLVYNPAETVFLNLATQARASVKNGYEMLEIQAEEGWQIWEVNCSFD